MKLRHKIDYKGLEAFLRGLKRDKEAGSGEVFRIMGIEDFHCDKTEIQL